MVRNSETTVTATNTDKATDMDLKFEDTEVPKVTRETKPNPFRDVLPLPEGAAKQVTVPTETETAYVNMARQAGREHETTTRVKVERDEKKKESTIIFWTVPKITRPRRNGDSKDESDAE